MVPSVYLTPASENAWVMGFWPWAPPATCTSCRAGSAAVEAYKMGSRDGTSLFVTMNGLGPLDGWTGEADNMPVAGVVVLGGAVAVGPALASATGVGRLGT